jgi:hypothetical protein
MQFRKVSFQVDTLGIDGHRRVAQFQRCFDAVALHAASYLDLRSQKKGRGKRLGEEDPKSTPSHSRCLLRIGVHFAAMCKPMACSIPRV